MSEFKQHCMIGFLLRAVLILFGNILDQFTEVKYTDIDYRVFTDAANHVVEGKSPFERHTYRYSPLLAYALTPNIFFHPAWGKFLFSLGDIIVCIFIRNILQAERVNEKTILRCVFFWLYNPVTIIISTRGNADSFSAVLVLGTLSGMKNKNYVLAGLLHGVSVHFRIYPIVYSLSMYLSIPSSIKTISRDESVVKKNFKRLIPNLDRLKLVFSCIVTLVSITYIFYSFYDYTFLHESFLYHFSRQDIRHNFSVFFYLQYLSVETTSIWHRLIVSFPQIILLIAISFIFGSDKHLCFAELCLAIVMVSYNSVLTCQYFIWFLSLIPLILPYLRFSFQESAVLGVLWVAAQLSWLLPAYWLEFCGRNTFIYIFFQSIAFFSANIAVFARLIRAYKKTCKNH